MHETMAPMVILRRAALPALVFLLGTAVARGQVQPPPATSPPPADLSGIAPPAAAPAPTPPGPTSPAATPPPASQPVEPLSPTLAPDAAPAPALVLTQRTDPAQQASRPQPLYRQTWFWAALGVVFVTATVILFFTLRDEASEPPSTTYGNMNAF
jgi:hypothetical protein